MRKNHDLHPHLHHTPIRQKSLTVSPYHLAHTSNYRLPAIQNLELGKSEVSKPKILFNYSPSTPKFAQEQASGILTVCSPQDFIAVEKNMGQIFQAASLQAKVQSLQTAQTSKPVTTLQSSKPILLQRQQNQFQKHKQPKLMPNYDPIAQVTPTLQDSHHEPPQNYQTFELSNLQREQEMIGLRRELNQTRSLNNQLRTDLLHCRSKLQRIQEGARRREQELQQELKELRIELQKAQNEKLLAQVSQAELQRKLRKVQEAGDKGYQTHGSHQAYSGSLQAYGQLS